jgi:hypothetical protein
VTADLAKDIADHERALRRAGLPNLIADYSAAEDVFTRALPVFGLVYLAEVANALNSDYSVGVNVLAAVGGIVVALGSFAIFNVIRGRPPASIPSRVGTAELAAFVVLPMALPLLFDLQWRSALVTGAVNILLIGVVYLVIGFGIVPIARWVGARFVDQLSASPTILVRAVPILVFFALIVFFAAEVWQVFWSVTAVRFWVGVGFFVVLGSAFLATRIPTSVRELERDSDLAAPLLARQRLNVGLVIFMSYALQVLSVAVAVWLFFVAIGALLVDPEVQQAWTGAVDRDVRETLPRILGAELHVTAPLLRVATGMAAISGLYYAVALVVDPTYRDELVERLTVQMRGTFALHAEYLALLRERDGDLGHGRDRGRDIERAREIGGGTS